MKYLGYQFHNKILKLSHLPYCVVSSIGHQEGEGGEGGAALGGPEARPSEGTVSEAGGPVPRDVLGRE